MPTDKRQRQKQARDARRHAERAAARRASLRRRVIGAVVVGALAVGLLTFLSAGNDDEEQVASEDTSSTTSTTLPVFAAECPPVGGANERRLQFEEAPPRCIEDGVDYRAVLKTSQGDITIDLLEERAPETVNNFVFLARWNYYDGVTFHRVVQDFVIQAGDPVGDPPGTGDPGYTIPDELPAEGEYQLGSLAMANRSPQPDTGGSQFFVIVGERGVQLPPQYALFGEVVEGIEVAEAIEALGQPDETPSEQVTIDEVEILER